MDVNKKTSPPQGLRQPAPAVQAGQSLRQRANELLSRQPGLMLDDPATTTTQDIRQLFHELQVHQIELEMQNDELQRNQTELEMQNDALAQAQQALQDERERFADLYEQAPVGYCTVNEAGLILQINRTAATLLGHPQDELLQQAITWFISYSDQDNYYLLRKRLAATGEPQSGELCMTHKDGTLFWVLLQSTVAQSPQGKPVYRIVLSDVTARKMADEKIPNLAFYDPLTHLPNRRLLMERLEVALAASLRYQRKGALLFIDLDGFKTINDTLGHLQGDMLLEQVATRLSTCVRESDTVARLGGDEFVVMLEHLSEEVFVAATEAEVVAEKILTTLDHLYPLIPVPCRITCSMGITLFGVDPHETLGEPMKRADLAMYQAKAGGRNRLRFFDPQMQAVVTARMALEKDLREAMTLGQFRLHYQPQMEGHRHLAGVEALLRWQRPSFGLVLPAEFIPLSEETGLILALGHWVLEVACAQLALWAQRPGLAHLTMAVNVSARQLHQSGFVQEVLRVLEVSGANPHRLKLELTESLMVSQVEDAIAKMGELKQRGVRFSLDDFGTGYSSLSHLKRMPLEQLKIDKGFVRDILTNPSDAAISKMVIALAQSIGLTVIAEGVETTAQRDFLASQGCHAYQGYLFSRPLPLDEFEAFAERASRQEG